MLEHSGQTTINLIKLKFMYINHVKKIKNKNVVQNYLNICSPPMKKNIYLYKIKS